MSTSFVLAPEIQSVTIRSKKTFQQLVLVRAELTAGEATVGSIPYIEFTLLGEGVTFTAHANRIPGTDRFNCFDLMEAVKQAAVSENYTFDRIVLQAHEAHYSGTYRIEGELLLK